MAESAERREREEKEEEERVRLYRAQKYRRPSNAKNGTQEKGGGVRGETHTRRLCRPQKTKLNNGYNALLYPGVVCITCKETSRWVLLLSSNNIPCSIMPATALMCRCTYVLRTYCVETYKNKLRFVACWFYCEWEMWMLVTIMPD